MSRPNSVRSVVEVTHTVHPGVFDGMANCLVARYIAPRASSFTLIEYPFEEKKGLPPQVRHYEGGKLIAQEMGRHFNGPYPVIFLADLLHTLHFHLRQRTKYDVFIGVDSLNAGAGLLLRALGLVRSVCFYSIDYSPKRFSNVVLNALYRFMEITATRKSDFVWCCSEQIQTVRLNEGCPPNRCLLVTPGDLSHGSKPDSTRKLSRLVYVGRLSAEKGVDLIIKAMPLIREKIPESELWVVGDGPQREELQALSKLLGLNRSIRFWGFLTDYSLVDKLIAQCGIGIACYGLLSSYVSYAFPGKMAHYLASALPVVMTKVEPYSSHLEDFQAGVVIDYSERALSNAVFGILASPEMYASYSSNAHRLAKKYDVEDGLARALSVSISTRNE